MELVRRRGSDAPLHFKLVLEGDLLLVVVIGIEPQRGQAGEVALSSFRPVLGYMVLAQLQRPVAVGRPPVGLAELDSLMLHVLAHLLELEQVNQLFLGTGSRLHHVLVDGQAFEIILGDRHLLGVLQVDVHQCLVDHRRVLLAFDKQRIVERKVACTHLPKRAVAQRVGLPLKTGIVPDGRIVIDYRDK